MSLSDSTSEQEQQALNYSHNEETTDSGVGMDDVPAAPLDAQPVGEMKRTLQIPADIASKHRWMERVFADPEISHFAGKVAARLMTFHNNASGQCNPKQETLAKAVNSNRFMVNAAIQELVDKGYVTATRTRGPKLYRLEVDKTDSIQPLDKLKRTPRRAAKTSTAEESAVSDVPPAEHQMCSGEHIRCASEDTSRCASEGTQNGEAQSLERMANQPKSVPVDRPTTVMAGPEIMPDKDAMPKTHRFGEFVVPDDVYQEWQRSFTHIKVDRTLTDKAGWVVTTVTGDRVKAMTTILRKADERRELEMRRIAEYSKAGKDAGDLDQRMPEAYSGWTKQHLPDIRVMPDNFTLSSPVSRENRPRDPFDEKGDISLHEFLSKTAMLRAKDAREVFEQFREEVAVNRIKSNNWIKEAEGYFKHYRKLHPPRNPVLGSGSTRGSAPAI